MDLELVGAIVGGGHFFFRMLCLFIWLLLRVLLRLCRLRTIGAPPFMGTTLVNHAGKCPLECMSRAECFSVTSLNSAHAKFHVTLCHYFSF